MPLGQALDYIASEPHFWTNASPEMAKVELRELTMCELDLKLSKFRRGEIAATPASQFQQICERFCTKYDAHPSHLHAWGAAPFCYSWNHASGWSFEHPA